MCGLFGQVGGKTWPEAPVLAALRGRGPDDQGRWSHGPALLLHTRLAIQDLSPLGHQPMLSSDGGVALVFNGEIYNQQALREELEQLGAEFRSRSDTEVLLEGFRHWGQALWGRLNGIFAVACWEVEAQRLTLARDGFGVKPLLWKRWSDGCAFGSELSAFEAAGLASRRRLDGEALASYALWGSVASPRTMLAGVEVFPAGHWGQWQRGRSWKLDAFADPLPPAPPGPTPRNLDEGSRQVADLLRQAVSRQVIGDRPVGLFLSGGLDSGLLAALLREHHGGPIRSVSVGFSDLPGAVDESELAAATAVHLGLEHQTLRITRQSLDASLDPFLTAIDQPSIDGFNSFLVARAAADNAMRVAFSGLGADELFGGYGHMAPTALARGPEQLLRVRQIRCSGLAREQRQALRQARNPGLHAPLNLRQASELELRSYLRDTLLRDGDAVTMHHGLELRVPFLDPDLAAAALSLPQAWHTAEGSKTLLRRLARPLLPAAVLAAPKRGFNLALAPWLLHQPRFAPRRVIRLLESRLGAQGLAVPSQAVWGSWLLLRSRSRWGPFWRWVVLAEWLAG